MSSHVSRYYGVRSNNNRRGKYEGAEHSKIRGLTVRLLMPTEIEKFRARVQAAIDRVNRPKCST